MRLNHTCARLFGLLFYLEGFIHIAGRNQTRKETEKKLLDALIDDSNQVDVFRQFRDHLNFNHVVGAPNHSQRTNTS